MVRYHIRQHNNKNVITIKINISETEFYCLLLYYCLLTAIGLMPGGSVTKIGSTYKKWTYIARKQNIQLTKKQHIHLTKNSISHKISQYSTSSTNNRIQDTIHRKTNKTQKQQNTKTREKLLPGIESGPSSL
jgi:hypothetical protein